MQVHLLGMTRFDWNTFLAETGKNIAPTNYNEQLTFILALHNMAMCNTTPAVDLRYVSTFLDTVSVVFMTDTEPKNWVMAVRCMSFPNDKYILFGTLRDWREAIIFNLHERALFEQREYFGTIMLEFERHKFGPLWALYSKQVLKDKTFILKEK